MRSPFAALLASLVLAAAPAMAHDNNRHDQSGRQNDRYHDNRGDNGRHDNDRHGNGHGYGRPQPGYYAPPPQGQWRPAPAHINPVYSRSYYGFPAGRVPYYHPLPARPLVYHAPPRPGYWYRGARYYDHGYPQTVIVNNYGDYGLLPPPGGYMWRRSSIGDFILVATATGIIADVLLSH